MQIAWLEWSNNAFVRSKREKKPILLCISATWCHWCHAMDRLTYSDSTISLFITDNFIPVRVDTDKRPDINERYNVGGWPSTLVLASDGEPISGATYVPPQNMLRFLEEGIEQFSGYKKIKKKDKRKTIVEKNKSIIYAKEELCELIKGFYDPINGGFGLEPKFPNADILDFLIWRVEKENDPSSRKILVHTLNSMVKGEFFDDMGGGFFRYATLQNWTIPHFEKMLEDNARLLVIYLKASRLLKNNDYVGVASKILFFLLTMLYDKDLGVFYASQDADEEYCKRPFEKRFHKKPSVDKVIFTDLNAQVARALLVASEFDKSYESLAERVLEYLYKNSFKGGIVHCAQERVYLLKDHVLLMTAFVDAFTRTRKLEWKARAEMVAKFMERFYDKKYGGFFDVLLKDAFGRLKDRKKPLVENVIAAKTLIELSRITKNERYKKIAVKSLEAVTPQVRTVGVYAAVYPIATETLNL